MTNTDKMFEDFSTNIEAIMGIEPKLRDAMFQSLNLEGLKILILETRNLREAIEKSRL